METLHTKEKNEYSSRNKSRKEIEDEYAKYLSHTFKYPKAQMCYYYFKGICYNKQCQFAHGFSDLNMDAYFSFIKDSSVFPAEKGMNWQKPYFYRLFERKDRTYIDLYNYQNAHKDKFEHIYTQQELIEDGQKRMPIRREIANEVLNGFVNYLFNKFKIIEINKLQKYITDSGYFLATKTMNRDNIFFAKCVKDKKTKKTYGIKYPSNEEMIQSFISIIIKYTKENKDINIFPFSFKSITNIINKNIGDYEPSSYHFMCKNNMTQDDFCMEIINKLKEKSDKGEFDLIKGKDIKDLFYQPDISEYIKEIKAGIYNRHFNLYKTPYAFIFFDEIINSYNLTVKKELSGKDFSEFDHNLIIELHKDKNLFFYDNTNTLYMINYSKFDNFELENFYDSVYYKKCFFSNVNQYYIQSLNNEKLSLSNELEDILDINQDSKKSIKIDKIKFTYTIKGVDILFIHDKESLDYFIYKSKQFKEISVDIEGRLRLYRPQINLIQICDNVENNTEIFVLDIYSFTNNESLKQYGNLLLTKVKQIFENPDIIKIFFDGRSDLSTLHMQFSICVCSYIDLSSLYCAAESFKEQSLYDKDCSSTSKEDFLSLIKSFINKWTSKGLNTVLYQYHPEHKINELKDIMHELFEKEKREYFTNRPINEEFLYYSAIDVKYLYDTFLNLKKTIYNSFAEFCGVVLNNKSEENLHLILLLISSGHLKAACLSYINEVNKTKIDN